MRRCKHILITVLAALAGLSGCASQDIHIYESTVDKPITVAVVDPIRDVTLWEMDVPVAHKLKLDLDRQPEFEPVYADMRPARSLSWRVYHENGGNPIESDRMDLPGIPVLLRISYRPAPEMPPGFALRAEETVRPMAPKPLRYRDKPAESATSGPATSGPATSAPADVGETPEMDAAGTDVDEATSQPSPSEAGDAAADDDEALPLPGLE